MNFLEKGIAVALFGFVPGLFAESYDHERLTTVQGRVFHDILVMGTDEHGLTFRHRGGIAKVPFAWLSESYRMFYEPVADLGDSGEASGNEGAAPAEAEALAGVGEVGFDAFEFSEPILLRAQNRVEVTFSPVWAMRGRPACGLRDWPAWWPRHAEVHRLADPRCRELAVRDFLFSSGLVRPACGPWLAPRLVW